MIITDQIGSKIILDKRPSRIISLVPSQSEFLWDIGLQKEIVGITKFCVHPIKMFSSVEKIGGTKNLNIQKIKQLKPDLIIGNKEENDKEQIEELKKHFPVWMSDIVSIEDALEMMAKLSEIFGKEDKTREMLFEILNGLKDTKGFFENKTVAYFMWNKPYMLAANGTFINSILEHIGLKNVTRKMKRYPEVNPDELKKLNPHYCFLSSEPFPFKQKHIFELQKILPQSRIILVDGEIFSWYGSRLSLFEEYVLKLKTSFKTKNK